MLLLIDHYDSFVCNLARYFERLGMPTHRVRCAAITCEEVAALAPSGVVLSPGPCTPREAGISLELVRRFQGSLPMLGICLGHQVLAEALGGRVVRAERPMHGQASPILHSGHPLFESIPSPFQGGRYHSLVVERESLPVDWNVTAQTADGVVMGLAHRKWPLFGLQFHPESILSEHGFELLRNFLRLAGLDPSSEVPSFASELRAPLPSELPLGPIPF